MAYIYKRGKYWWVGYNDGTPKQASLKVTAQGKAKVLLADYQAREARHYTGNKTLTVKTEIAGLFDEYLWNRTFRPETRKWYGWCKETFLDFCEAENLRFVSSITVAAVERYYNGRRHGAHSNEKNKKKAERRKKAGTPGGARSNLRALRAVLGYAVKKGYLQQNPALHVKAEKPVKKIFRTLSFEDVEHILEAARKRSPAIYPLYAIGYYAGLRANELRYLEGRDINYSDGYLLVRSKPENLIKDHQERRIPLNSKLREILKSVEPGKKWLFETQDGRPRVNNLNRELKLIAKAAGVTAPEDVSLQILRETFGSHLRRKGVDIALISQYMGHSSIDVTLRHYAHIAIEQTHKEIDLL